MEKCANEGCERSALPQKTLCARHVAQGQFVAQAAEEAVLGAELVAEIQAPVEAPVEPKPRRGRKPVVEEPEPDPEAAGGEIAQRIYAEQVAARARAARGTPLQEEQLRRVPVKIAARRTRRDATVIVDPETHQSLVKPGWVPRWVRKRDHLDRLTESRVADFKDYGYEVIVDGTGKAVESHLGVAMQAPREQYALRVIDHAPLGALSRDERLESAYQAAEETNRYAGEEVARVVVSKKSESVRRYEPDDDDF